MRLLYCYFATSWLGSAGQFLALLTWGLPCGYSPMAGVAVSPLMCLLIGSHMGLSHRTPQTTSSCGLDIPMSLQLGSKDKHPEKTNKSCTAFKKKNKTLFIWMFGVFIISSIVCLNFSAHVLAKFFIFSLPFFSFTSFSQETCKTFFWKIFCYQWNIFHDFMLWFPSPFHSNDYFNS